MKLLFDQNLSPRLPVRLADLFPGSAHVADIGLDQADDDVVWEYARVDGFLIVSKDSDYPDLSVLRGHPPMVVWLQLGNCTTGRVEACFRANHAAVEAFVSEPTLGVISLR